MKVTIHRKDAKAQRGREGKQLSFFANPWRLRALAVGSAAEHPPMTAFLHHLSLGTPHFARHLLMRLAGP